MDVSPSLEMPSGAAPPLAEQERAQWEVERRSKREGEERPEGEAEERPERTMGAKASAVASTLIFLLVAHVRGRRAGRVFTADAGYYRIFPHAPRQVRYPDISFVRTGRLPDDRPPDGTLSLVPDLVVEVVSPNDSAEDVEARVMDFARVQVPLMWVVYPKSRCVRVLRNGNTALQLTEGAELTGDEVLADFRCRVAELFAEE